jgi:DNA polymerase III sliding clamp (beta) subunit (PCNA family)
MIETGMTLTVMGHELQRAVDVIGRIDVEAEENLVLLSTIENGLSLNRLGKAGGITATVSAHVDGRASAVVSLYRFASAVRNVSSHSQVELRIDDEDDVFISAGSYTLKLLGDDPVAYTRRNEPQIVSPSGGVKLLAEDLHRALLYVERAMRDDDERPVLEATLLRITENRCEVVAADGWRLAQRVIKHDDAAAKAGDVLVPSRTVDTLLDLLAGVHGKVEIEWSDTWAWFKTSTTILLAPTQPGVYPGYHKVFNMVTHCATSIVVSTSELLTQVRQAALVSNILKLTVGDIEGRVALEVMSLNMGDFSGSVDASIQGEEMTICVSPVFLQDALEVLDTAWISIELQSPASPLVICVPGEQDRQHYIMPLTVR